MATAQIKINSVSGSNTDLPLNTLVALSNNDNTGATAWEWTIISQPAGPADVLSSLNTSTSSFTPTKEGSYLIRLVVNKGLAGEATNQVVAAVRELETRSRIPAAGETVEVDSNNGWANAAVSEILQRVTRFEDNGYLVGKADAALTPQQVVHISDAVEIAAGLPGQRTVAAFDVAYANIMNHLYGTLGVYISQVDGTAGASAGDLVRVLTQGPLSGVSLGGSGSVGEPVYVNDLGGLSLVPGTNSRQVGTIAHAPGAGVYDLWISGIGGASGTPVGAAGGILGYPSSTYPNPNGLSANSSDLIPVAPYTGSNGVTFKADDQSTMNATSIGITAGNATAGSYGGGNIDLTAGASVGGSGGNITLTSAAGANGGDVTIYGGTASVNAGGSVLVYGGSGAITGGSLDVAAGAGPTGGSVDIYAGQSSAGTGGALTVSGGAGTTTGGSAALRGGFASTSAGTGGAAIVSAGSGGSAGVGGEVRLRGGDVTAAVGGSITLGGGLASPVTTGTVTIKTENAAAAGSAGNIAILGGSGGAAGTAGNITILAGNSTQNSATADGGQVAITAGNNATANGQGGTIVLTAGVGGTATGAVLQLAGGKTTTQGGALITGGAASATSTAGGAIELVSGIGAGNTIAPGDVSINVGSNSGTAKANINIGTSGSLNAITLGRGGIDTKIPGRFVLPQVTQVVNNASQILTSTSFVRILAPIGSVNLTSTPTIPTTDILEGTRLLIMNAGNNSVAFNDNDHVAGTLLQLGANTRSLSTGGVIEFLYTRDHTNTYYWYEISYRG